MAISVKHKFASPKGDSPDVTLVRPSNWNDEHDITCAGKKVLGRTATAGAIEELDAGTVGQAILAADTQLAARAAAGQQQTADIADDAVTLDKLLNATGTSKLLGRYNAGAGSFEEISIGSDFAVTGGTLSSNAVPRGYLSGMGLSNSAADLTNDIVCGEGTCRNHDNTFTIVRAAALTKQLNAAWAAGNNNGMRSSAALADGTWHIFAIAKADGTSDYFAHNAVSPAAVLPVGYTKYRRIGSILRESGSIVAFKQIGNYFQRKAWADDVDDNNPGTARKTYTLSVPTGLILRAEIAATVLNNSGGPAATMHFSDPDVTNEASDATHAHLWTESSTRAAGQFVVGTNDTKQITARFSASSPQVTLKVATRGWYDDREV
jgi:hypothetical protein